MNNVDIRSYLRPLLKWWWLLGVATLIAAFSSFIYTVKQPLVYQELSRTTVVVGSTIQDPNPNYGRISLAGQLASAYADMATRTPVRQATMAALKVDQLPYYNVSVVPNTQIIEIDVYDLDPQRAYVVANELVNQLILFGPAGDTKRLNGKISLMSRLLNWRKAFKTPKMRFRGNRSNSVHYTAGSANWPTPKLRLQPCKRN